MLTTKYSIKPIFLKQFFICNYSYSKLFEYHKEAMKFLTYHTVCLWLKNNDERGPLSL